MGTLQRWCVYPSNSSYPRFDTACTFDERNRLTDIASETVTEPSGGQYDTNRLAAFHYNPADRPLDPTGLRRAAREKVYAATTIDRAVDYTYDRLHRLTREDITQGPITGAVTYTNTTSHQGYDNVGNRRSRAVAGPVNAVVTDFDGHVFDVRDRLTTGYTYDGNGNTRTGPTGSPVVGDVSCGYDFENRLVWQTNADGTVVHLQYDGDGNRASKSVTSGGSVTTSYYVVDDQNPTGYPQVMLELEPADDIGFVGREYCYGLNLVSETSRNGRSAGPSSFYGYDGHGNVRFLVNDAGEISDTYTYDAFGIEIANSGTTANNYRYCGEPFDSDLGLYYLRARYYNPQAGRFWTMDSYEAEQEDPLSLHKYLYCKANPINATDRSGNLVDGISMMVSTLENMEITSRDGARVESGRQRAMQGIAMTVAILAMVAMETIDLGEVQPQPELEPIPIPPTLDPKRGNPNWVFRANKQEGGKPKVGEKFAELGVRPKEIPVGPGNMVSPNTGGMSVAPATPLNLLAAGRNMVPPSLGGTGEYPVWGIHKRAFGPALQVRVNSPTHAFVEPAFPMTKDDYLRALAGTRDFWLMIAR